MPKQRREYKLYNEEIERTFTQHQTQITQLDDSITLQASTITSLDGKVEEYYSQLVIADQGITSTVATKVGADSIISTINQSAESVTIDASKINLSADVVTFTKLSAYDPLNIASANSSGETLTINGSRMVGTDSNGYTGYVIKPYGLEIYNYTTTSTLVSTLRAKISSQVARSTSGSSLSWTLKGETYGGIWAEPNYGTGFGIQVPRSSASGYDYYLTYGVNSDAEHVFRGTSFIFSMPGADYIKSTVRDLVSGYKPLIMDENVIHLGMGTIPLTLSGTSCTVSGSSLDMTFDNLSLTMNGSTVCTVSGSSLDMTFDNLSLTMNGSTISLSGYPNGLGYHPRIEISGENMTIRGNELDIRDLSASYGMFVAHSHATFGTGLALYNHANSSGQCSLVLGYDGSVKIIGTHLYFNGTQIA